LCGFTHRVSDRYEKIEMVGLKKTCDQIRASAIGANILAWCLFCSVGSIQGQSADSTSERSGASKNVVFSVGITYSNLSLASEPYFADSAGKVGYSNIENGAGLSLGVGYNIHAGKNLLFRPAVEAVVLAGRITYDTDINYKIKSDVWPVALEVPLTLIYSKHLQAQEGDEKSYLPEIGLGIRPAFALEYFMNMRPTMQTFNLNADVLLGMPFRLKKANARIELLYSHGFNNLIGEDPGDFQTYTISELTRSYFGLRLVLN
jgi:hypothetical protein